MGGPRGGGPPSPGLCPGSPAPHLAVAPLEDHGESAVPNQVLARELELAHGLQAAAAGLHGLDMLMSLCLLKNLMSNSAIEKALIEDTRGNHP